MCETLRVGSACQTQGLNHVSCYRGNSYSATMRPIQPSLFLSGYHQTGVATQPVSCLPGMRLEGISSVALASLFTIRGLILCIHRSLRAGHLTLPCVPSQCQASSQIRWSASLTFVIACHNPIINERYYPIPSPQNVCLPF